MDSQGLQLLEYPEVLTILGGWTQSELGRAEIDRLQPLSDRRSIENRLSEVEEFTRLRSEEGALDLWHLHDPTSILERLTIQESLLAPQELLLLSDLLRAGIDLRGRCRKEEWPLLTARWQALPNLDLVARRIDKTIDPSGEIREDAHPELRDIRAKLQRCRKEVQERLRGYFSGPKSKYLIAEPFVTQRNNRYVIPVKAEHQRNLPGVVHSTSSSGATLFVEPLPAVELNNQCIYCEEREQEVIRRILAELTAFVRPHCTAIERTRDQLAFADALQACAEFSRNYGCVIPRLNRTGRLLLREVRHPLLRKTLGEEKVVPITVTLAGRQNVLIISGPNTGGKTVALKTIGLVSLMAQSGLPVPAAEAELPLFRQVLADIGDRQSISENLSTFSSHILRIQGMMNQLDPPSLILLDEIGTGTDPSSGAALGISIIEHFRKEGALVVATTHHQSIKQFAAGRPEIVNACVELDPSSLRPTYALTFGIAGTSSAFEIAEQLGLPHCVLEGAQRLLGQKEIQIEQYLTTLREQVRALEETRQELEKQSSRLERREADLRREFEEREKKREKAAVRALEQWAKEFKQETSRFLKGIKDRFESARVRQEAQQRERLLKEAFRRKMSSVETLSGPRGPESAPFRPNPGDWVYSRFFKKRGRVLSVGEETALLEVEGKRLRTPLDHLSSTAGEPSGPASRRITLDVVEESEPELNLIGFRVDEALSRADKFLDRAFLSHLSEVRIVHGFGTGRLRQALSDFLSQHPQVLGHRVEGGVTLVTLKE